MKRYLLIALAAVVVIIAAGIAVLSGRVDSFRPKIQAELQDKLKRPVTLGHLGLKLFPLSIEIDGFSLGDDPAFASAQSFATASKVYVSAELFSLLGGNPQVKEVILDQPQIELIRNAAGKWNFSSLGGGTSSSGGNSRFALDKLEIKDGRVALTDALHQQARNVYDHIDLTMNDFSQDKPFSVDLGVHLPGAGKQLAEFKGKVGPLTSALPPVVGHLSLEQVSLSAVNRFAAGALPANTDSVLSGGTDVDTSGGKIGAKGDLEMENTMIRGSKLDYAVKAKYDLSADQAFDSLAVKSMNLTLGSTTLDASGTINNAAKPAVLDLQVKTNDSSLTELAKLAGSVGVAFNPDYKVDGRLTLNVSAKGPANAPQLNGNITLKNVSASGGAIKEPVSTPEIDLAMTPQSIVSNTFTAKSGSTSLDASLTLMNYSTKDPVADVALRSSNAQIAELLNIAKAYGVSAANGISGTGALSIDVHAHGDTAHPEALTYAGTASLQEANISTPQLTKSVLIHSANAQFSQNSVALTNLSAAVGGTSLSGTLSANNFAAPVLQFALAVDKIDTDELQNLLAKTPPAKTAAPASSGPSILNVTTGGGTLSVNTIKAQQIVLTSVSTTAKLDHGLITLSPLSAGAFNGKINGSLSADMRPATPDCSVNAKLTGMDANSLMSAVSSMKNELYGSLGATTKLKFALASGNDLAKTLNGSVDFALANGELKNVNILGEVSKFQGLLGGKTASTSSGSSTKLTQLSGTLNFVNGLASTNNLKAVTDSGTIAANGSVNLVNQGLDMHMTAGIGNGLAIPVLVTGTTDHMKFAPDMQALAKKNLGGVLGAITGKNPDAKTANPVDSILGGFLKKKPQ
jgi:AsmA protein